MKKLLDDPAIALGLKKAFTNSIAALELEGKALSSSDMFKYTSFYTGDAWSDNNKQEVRRAA